MNDSLICGETGWPDLEALGALILQARRILVVTHVAPDGDAIGSLLALGWLLRAQGIDVTMACEDSVPEAYRWLPASEEIVRYAGGAYDLLISLDCSDRRRMGQVFDGHTSAAPLLNIDHHITNTRFGTVNWVDPSSVSTTQMILQLADALQLEISARASTYLLTGLVTDTRSFRTANVDARALRAALRLVEAGASLADITQKVLEQRPLASVRLWGSAIDHLHLEDGVLWTAVTRDMRQRWSIGDDGDSGLANFLSGIREADVVVVFTEREDGTVDVGLRAVPTYDVARVAVALGGGGHPQAAGCTLDGSLAEVAQFVLAEVQLSLRDQRGNDP